MLNGQRILIENTPGMGDLVMLTPTLRRLKELFPRCVLSVVSYGENLPLVARLPYVDAVYGIWRRRVLGRFRPIAQFLSQDWCIFTTWQPQLAVAARLLSRPHRAGVCRPGRERQMGFHAILPSPQGGQNGRGTNEFQASFLARQVFGALGVSSAIDERCDVSQPNTEERECARALLRAKGWGGEPYAVFAPFAKTEQTLPMPLVQAAARHLSETYGIPSVLVGAKGDVGGRAREWIDGMGGVLYDVTGETNLMTMTALLRDARLALVTDSGPMHIACALGTPTVAVFSSGNLQQWAPRAHCRVVSLRLPCSPCDGETAAACPRKRCIEEIEPEMVLREIDACLSEGV